MSRFYQRCRAFERLEDRRLLAHVALNLHVTDLAGRPLANNEVAIGNDFLLRATVQDISDDPSGVFAAFLDVAYDNPSAFSLVYSEVQRLTLSNKTVGGTYTLTLGSETTGDIATGNSAEQFITNLQSGLEGLSTIGPGNVEVVQNQFIDDRDPSRNNPFRFDIKFVNALFETDVSNLTGDPSGLIVSEGNPSLVVEEIAKGVRSDAEAFRRAFTPGDDYPNGLTAEDGDRDPESGVLLDAQVFSEVGSFDGIGFFGEEGAERLLWSVRLNADAAGVIRFQPNPADTPVISDVLVFGTVDPVPLSEIEFGEVSVRVVSETGSLDFGDAPDPSYPTRLPTGAAHTLGSGLLLGTTVDAESDGQPNPSATGDDNDGINDDDGVQPIAGIVATATSETTSSFHVTASLAAKLDAWIDFDGDGQFDHPQEHLGDGISIDLDGGGNVVSFRVPAGATIGDTFARFRLSSLGGLLPAGLAGDGEVEDYQIEILDGNVGASVPVNLLIDEIEIKAVNDRLEIRSDDDQLLFAAPGTAVDRWQLHGTSLDNTVRLGNLTAALPTPVPFHFEGGPGTDTLQLVETNQSVDTTNAEQYELRDIEVIDITSVGSNQLKIDPQSVLAATDTAGTLLIRHDEDDSLMYGDGWTVEPPIFAGGQQRHVMTGDSARVEIINTLPFQNPLSPTDVNFSGESTSLDALQGINFLGRFGSTSIPLNAPTSSADLPVRYYDVNGSRTASALDSLVVINFLGRQSVQPEAIARPIPAVPLPDSAEWRREIRDVLTPEKAVESRQIEADWRRPSPLAPTLRSTRAMPGEKGDEFNVNDDWDRALIDLLSENVRMD